MLIYLFLFATGFANEAILTRYYVLAGLGERWKCVGLCVAQQIISCSSLYFTIVDVKPASREQLIRWVITAISYGFATYWIVKPIKKEKEA